MTLRWSKTLQDGSRIIPVPVPHLPQRSALDPVAAMREMLRRIPTRAPDDPLLLLPDRTLVTTHLLASALRTILTGLGLTAGQYSLHSLRRGGATESFRAGADLADIKRHGAWRSDSVWDYITSRQVSESDVALRLRAAAASSPRDKQ